MKEFMKEIGRSVAGLAFFALIATVALAASNATAGCLGLVEGSVAKLSEGGQSFIRGY